ncbi:MAG: Tol-Pal system beta propeller repeat protein TolB [Candidatus Abyssobacteria bacterium SURF_17]|uniref:Tol-Pal system beta propeller repeat protein TolB n=1 Tax=Candidatus Abyssobacteria bacterium SURF_17 TaxID=2093361 RepID=A0A419EPS5_9BACT|nr:MAG: Tol-Pal system beta propeller repeat protein TolB [Candidatus Abyssubacteria bacterium SURF_17]
MIHRLRLAILSASFVILYAGTLFGQGDIIINIHEPGTTRIKIGVPAFVKDQASPPAQQANLGEDFSRVIRDDLDFTGLFQVFAAPSQHNSSDSPLKAWEPLGVESVVRGAHKSLGQRVGFECALFDVESETRIVGRYYTGLPDDWRAIAHSFSDEIVYRYTGKRGIAHTQLAYLKAKGGTKEIHIMDYDGHNSYQLTFDKSIALSPDWSPDGKKLVFTSYRDHNPDVHMVDLGKRTYTRLSGYIGLNTTPAFSPDGKTLALTLSKDGNPELYLFTMANGGLTRLTRNSRVDTSPTWSPNGREIAFVSDRSGSPQIYVTDREGVNLRRLTYSGSYNTSPAWSPLGDKIAYVSLIGGRGEIFTISPTGSDVNRLTFNGGNEDPSWSPDGRYLAFSSKQLGQRDVYLMRDDGSGIKRVTFGGGDNMSPAWSP